MNDSPVLAAAGPESAADVHGEASSASGRTAGGAGRGAEAVLQAVMKEPWRFGFYAALRAIQCARPAVPLLGRSRRVADDPVRFGQQPSLKFAGSTLASSQAGGGGRPARILTHFFGLFGPNGALPAHLTEFALERRRDVGDVTFARFVDVFHHRMTCLFFRAWADAQPAVAFDRPETDRFSTFVGALCGLGMPELRRRDEMPDAAKLHFAAFLGGRTRHPEGLVAILTTFFGVPVRVRQFVGHWMELPGEYRCVLGRSPRTGTLGRTATIGSRVWDCQSRFALIAGPLSLRDYLRLLPGAPSLSRFVAVVRNAVGDELAWDLRLVLRRDEVPAARLDGTAGLGRTAWLLGRPAERDADDFHFSPQQAA